MTSTVSHPWPDGVVRGCPFILSDGATSRAMVLGDPDYGRHARVAAETLLDHASRRARA
ncbi:MULTISPECIES: hypothetical protein [unclassified Streptomyces]|uniref:hypothetical protein n=1 Tax=unclassified Streptomyces TaxID=2593676 RepID=UPI002E2E7D26|nr:hypothetical protein [Streptomyces sp. NBC_01429]